MCLSNLASMSHLPTFIGCTAVYLCLIHTTGCAQFSKQPSHTHCDKRGFGPWEQAGKPAARPESAVASRAASVPDARNASDGADALLVGYQRYLRRPTLPGAGCRFHPSCSEYARQAFRRYYAPGGLLLTVDRLFIREHHFVEHHYLPVCDSDGSTHLSDPVP